MKLTMLGALTGLWKCSLKKKSFEAHAEKERLKKENFELRKENDKLFIFQLETKVERLTSQVEALKCDPILLEIREVLCNLEEKVVDKISQDPENTVFLSQVTLDEVAIEKWHSYCGIRRADLYAFSTMLQTIALARIKVAHPTPNLENYERWKTELRNLCAKKVKTDSISNIINLALQEL